MRTRDLTIPFWMIIVIQVLSFIVLVLPKALMMDVAPIQLLLILTEVAILLPLLFKLPRWIFYLIWEVQIFLLILSLVLFDFESTFQVQNPSPIAIRSMVVGIAFIEILVLLGFIFKERAVKPILISLSSITSISVVVIVIFIVSEGHYAFIENDPVEYLTGDTWSPFYHEPLYDEEFITIMVETYEFDAQFQDEQHYIRPYSNFSVVLHIENMGPKNESYSIILETDNLISLRNKSFSVMLASKDEIDLNVSGFSGPIGRFYLGASLHSPSKDSTKEAELVLIVGEEGVDFEPEVSKGRFSGYDSPPVSPLTIANTGSVSQRYLVTVNTTTELSPSIQNLTTTWDYNAKSAYLDLEPGMKVNCWLNPIITRLSKNDYEILVNVRSVNDPSVNDTVKIVYEYKTYSLFWLEERQYFSEPSGRITVPISAMSETQGATRGSLSLYCQNKGFTYTFFDGNSTKVITGEKFFFKMDENSTADISVGIIVPDDIQIGEEVVIRIIVGDEGSKPRFGIGPLILGTMLTTVIALIIAVPLGLAAAIFLAEYCYNWLRRIFRPLIELLAGIPSIIYGLWGYLILGPFLMDGIYPFIDRTLGRIIPIFAFTDQTPGMGETVLTAGFVLAIMVLPIIITLSEDAIRAVPSSLREGGNALGTSKWQTIRHIVLKKARSGIISSIILAMGRAIGETMAIVMIMKIVTAYPNSLMEKAGSMTAMIAGVFGWSYDLELTRHAIFGIAMILFFIVFILNIIVYRVQLKSGRSGKKTFLTRFVDRILGPLGKNRGAVESSPKKERSIGSFRDRMGRTKKVMIQEWIVKGTLTLSTLLIIVILFFILGNVLYTGITTLTVEHFLQKEVAGGIGGGGYNNAMIGSILLTLLTMLMAVPLSLGTAIYVQQYAKESSLFGRIVLFTSDTLASTPSIVFGAFGFIFFSMFLEFRVSMFAAALTLALMAIPLLLRSSIEALKSIPKELGEASLALGATKWQSIYRVILPPAMGGISSGVILGIGRVIGETAAILFTAGYAFGYARSIMYPVATMPSMIYSYYDLSVQYPELWDKVYSAAFVLILIVLVINTIARIIQVRSTKMSSKY